MPKTKSDPPGSPVAPRPASGRREPADYEPPKLTKFQKLEKLIVSGE